MILINKNYTYKPIYIKHIPYKYLHMIQIMWTQEMIPFLELSSSSINWEGQLEKFVHNPTQFIQDGGWLIFDESESESADSEIKEKDLVEIMSQSRDTDNIEFNYD